MVNVGFTAAELAIRSNRLLGVVLRGSHVLLKVVTVIIKVLDEHGAILGYEVLDGLVLCATKLVSRVDAAGRYPRVETRNCIHKRRADLSAADLLSVLVR
jgi:hypothetical protein